MVSMQMLKAINPFSLRFSKEEEKVFLEKTFIRQLKMVRFAFLFAMLLFIAFGLLDFFLFPLEVKALFVVRYFIIIPVSFMASIVTYSHFFKCVKEVLTFCSVVLAGVFVIAMNVLVVKHGAFNVHYAGLLLTFFFCYIFSKLQFIWASIAGFILLVIYNITFIWITPLQMIDILSANFILIALNVLGMIACYWSEYYTRTAYLTDKALRNEKEEIEAINLTLEESIYERTKALMHVTKSLQEEIQIRVMAEGGNRICIANALHADEIDEHLYLSHKLSMAAERNQLFMVYQPKICAQTGLTVGVEALMRWELPEKGLIPPDKFIPIAESTGLIHGIGEWMIDRVCKDLHTLPQFVGKGLSVNVNFSAMEFSVKEIVARFATILEAHDMDASRFCIEITESTMMIDMDGTLKKLESFKKMGVKIAIDDFGTGYSSLSYLSKLPIDELKIDQSFIQKIGQSVEDEHIIRTIVTLARNLKLRVVSEGVEHQEQVAFLRDLSVDELQGYFFARPLTLENLAAYIENEKAFIEN